jgi:hypothetical protein
MPRRPCTPARAPLRRSTRSTPGSQARGFSRCVGDCCGAGDGGFSLRVSHSPRGTQDRHDKQHATRHLLLCLAGVRRTVRPIQTKTMCGPSAPQQRRCPGPWPFAVFDSQEGSGPIGMVIRLSKQRSAGELRCRLGGGAACAQPGAIARL